MCLVLGDQCALIETPDLDLAVPGREDDELLVGRHDLDGHFVGDPGDGLFVGVGAEAPHSDGLIAGGVEELLVRGDQDVVDPEVHVVEETDRHEAASTSKHVVYSASSNV